VDVGVDISTIIISSRYCGPPRSGNGGYVCGRIAAALPGPAAVRLKLPPPLEQPMQLRRVGDAVQLLHEERVVGEARSTVLDLSPPVAPSYAQAEQASAGYTGFGDHAFPRCFVCGPQRNAGDGLRIFPGPVLHPQALVAAPWIPDRSLVGRNDFVCPEFLWAALDCPSGWAVLPVPEGKAILLGELCAEVRGAVRAGEHCVVVGWMLAVDGRKRYAGCAVFAPKGQLVALGKATWLEVPRGA
jgi:hypothetical protein